VPFDLPDDIELVARTKPISIWLDFVNRRSAGAKSKRGVGLIDNLSLRVGDDSVANVFRGESEYNHGCLDLAEALDTQYAYMLAFHMKCDTCLTGKVASATDSCV
jgi:hypothetical protein